MFPALVLAGGASTRMGLPKATMLVDGSQMIVHVAHALRDGGCTKLYIAVRDGHQRLELMSSLTHLTDVEFILDEVAILVSDYKEMMNRFVFGFFQINTKLGIL